MKSEMDKTKEEESAQTRDRCGTPLMSDINSHRVFKKSSPNNKLTLYLNSRDLSISGSRIDHLQGIIYVDPEYLEDKKVYGQVTLTFRYGREDEEVMGLKFCNEAVMSLAQLYPKHEKSTPEPPTPLQEALMKRLGPNAHPFTMTVTNLAPPSVQLVPAKVYNGAPIGTSYDIRAYIADRPDDKLQRRSTVRMAIRVVQRAATKDTSPKNAHDNMETDDDPAISDSVVSTAMEQTPPRASVDKPFLLSDGKVEMEASLNKAVYHHGEPVCVTIHVRNNSGKTVRRIKIFAVQFVDVCMFSNGKFKNIVALVNSKDECPLQPWTSFTRTYTLQPAKGATKNWIALEDSFSKTGAVLASTVTCPSKSPDDRNVFAIYVSYYVKVKAVITPMGGELSVKLPFTLIHAANDLEDTTGTVQTRKEVQPETEEKEKVRVAKMDVQVECHEPKSVKNINDMLPKICKPKKSVIRDENEIIKCEDEDNI